MDRRTGEGREINSSLNPQQQQVVSADQNDYDVYSLSTTLGDSTAALDEYYRYVSCFFTDHAHQQQEFPLVDCYHYQQQQQQQLPSNNNDYNISSEVTDHEPAGSSGSSLNISSDLAVAFRNNNCSSEPVPADGSAIAGTSVSSASSDEDLSEKFTEGGGNDVGDEGEEKSTTVNSTSTNNTTTTTNNKGKKKAAQKRVRQQRFAFVTKSDVDHLEDGYRWRKYGQKAVKNSPYPRSYYRCTNSKCTVKKRVERSSEDPAFVITTYEGQHCHHNIGFPRGIASSGYNNMLNYENAAAAAALMSSRSSYPQLVPLQSYTNNYHIRMQQHQQQQQRQFPSSSSLLEASAPAAGNNNNNPATTTATMSSSSSSLLLQQQQQQQRIRSRSNRSESNNINAAGSNIALTNSGLGLQLQTGEEVYHHQHQHHQSQVDEGLLGDIVSPRSRML